MFARLSLALLAASFAFAAATPLKRQLPGVGSLGGHATTCNAGTLQCCNNTQEPSSANYHHNLGLLREFGFLDGLDIPLQGSSVPLGVNCSPINVPFAGGSGGTCNTEPVCCRHTSSSGLIAAGCTPAVLNL